MKHKRAALYLRVSSDSQTVENQRAELLTIASARGYEVRAILEETHSSTKGDGPKLLEAMELARRGRIDVVIVWALDRIGRSMADTVRHVTALDRLGVALISAQEAWVDGDSFTRPLLIAMFAWVAEQETRRLSARSRAGQARARLEGKHIGRPSKSIDVKRAKEVLAVLSSIKATARTLGIPETTLRRAMRAPKVPPDGAPRLPAISGSTHA